MLKSRIVITIKTTRKCPRGGEISPLLWSLVIDELLTELTGQSCEVIGFADDLFIMVLRERRLDTVGSTAISPEYEDGSH
jgi:Reverse transcriptase (RNA-dependent DNA polymerase)